MSESLRSLTKNEEMSESLVFLSECSFAHFFAKTSDMLGKSMSEFSALVYGGGVMPHPVGRVRF